MQQCIYEHDYTHARAQAEGKTHCSENKYALPPTAPSPGLQFALVNVNVSTIFTLPQFSLAKGALTEIAMHLKLN